MLYEHGLIKDHSRKYEVEEGSERSGNHGMLEKLKRCEYDLDLVGIHWFQWWLLEVLQGTKTMTLLLSGSIICLRHDIGTCNLSNFIILSIQKSSTENNLAKTV